MRTIIQRILIGLALSMMLTLPTTSHAALLVLGPEKLAFDTISEEETNVSPSWVDLSAHPLSNSNGVVEGISLPIQEPIVVSRVEFDLGLDNDNGELESTQYYICVFRNDFEFKYSSSAEPMFYHVVFPEDAVLKQTGDYRYTLSVELEPFIWGTNRILAIYSTAAWEDTPFAKLNWYHGKSAPKNSQTFESPSYGKVVRRSHVPGFRVWTKPVEEIGLQIEAFDDKEVLLQFPPGVMLGLSTTGLRGPFDWSRTDFSNGRSLVDTDEYSSALFRIDVDRLP